VDPRWCRFGSADSSRYPPRCAGRWASRTATCSRFSWVGERLITTCKRLVAPEVARAVEVLMQREGVTLEDRLEGLEQEREAYVREQYGLG
jgi:uncharacterized protein YllA (UPF0747 family)